MSAFPPPDPEHGAVDAGGGIRLLPTLHQSVEFAVLVRRAMRDLEPNVVALELPRTVESAFLRGVARLPRLSVVLYPDGEDTVYLPVEPHEPMVEGARLAQERGARVALVDRDDGSYPFRREPAPDPYAITMTGPAPFVAALLDGHPASEVEDDRARERAMAFRLRRLAEGGSRVLWIGGAAHARGILKALEEPLAEPFERVKREGVMLAQLADDNLAEVMSVVPWLSASYEEARAAGNALAFDERTDALRSLDRLLRAAAEKHAAERKETVTPPAFAVLSRFARNLALVEGSLVPRFYELIVASRGAVDDDFAHTLFGQASAWPFPRGAADLPEVRLRGEDLFLSGKKVRFRRRFPGKGERIRGLPLRKRPRATPLWKTTRFGTGICSYPPEDVAVERFGNGLRARALARGDEERRRKQPLLASLLDGVDVRESLRHLHQGRLWVYEERLLRGEVGSVVVVFDEDEDAYPWHTTWIGEHGQESDMAFLATRPGAQVDGPGIARCVYGAFLMTFPPGRLDDVFADPDYDGAESGAERLLYAGLDYALESRVVHVAPRPPRAQAKRFAARLGKTIVHVPLKSLSPITAKRLRVFHVLAHRGVRAWAKDYVGR